MMPEQAPVESEFDRAVKHWRWCWDCGARASDCYENQDDYGTKCCPDCRHRNTAPSLRAELAEAKATIKRLTIDNDKYRRDFVMIGATVGRQREIVEAATALAEHIRHGMKDFTSGVDPVHGRLEDALAAAVEEGGKT